MSRHRTAGIAAVIGLGASLSLAESPARAGAGGYPPESVLLFVASWCAPCHAELARLPEISRGARPYRVLVVPFDDGAATRAMLAAVPEAQRWRPERAVQRQLTRDVAAESSGLPFSLAVDAAGRTCASAREGLNAARAGALVGRCRRP